MEQLLCDSCGGESVVGELRLWLEALNFQSSYAQLKSYFQRHQEAPGVLVLGDEPDTGFACTRAAVCRQRFLERVLPWLCEGELPDPNLPIADLHGLWRPLPQLLVLDAQISVAEGAALALQRPKDEFSDPIVVRLGRGHALLDVRQLLAADARMQQRRMAVPCSGLAVVECKPAAPVRLSARPRPRLMLRAQESQVVPPEQPREAPQPDAHLRLLVFALKYVSDAVAIADADGLIIYVNLAFEQLMGYSLEEATGHPLVWMLEGGEPSETDLGEIWSAVSNGQLWSNRITAHRRDGSQVRMESIVYPVRGGDGTIAHYVAVQQEVGRDRATAGQLLAFERIRKLEDQTSELQRLARSKDEFLSTVSHELRTPLANMKLAITMLKNSSTEDKRELYLRHLEAECLREKNLIEDLLSMQQLETNHQAVQPEVIDLHQWLPHVVNPFRLRIEQRQQQLLLEIDPDISTLVCDRKGLERILVELLNNACKYTPPNERIGVWLGRGPHSAFAQPTVELRVSNTGVQIPLKELPRIFDKFYRIPSTDPWGQGGTGLGLALVKKLVELLGGAISVQSHSGRTTFSVELPQLGQQNAEAISLPAGGADAPAGSETAPHR
jgi:PAS domain S-box-containing protein